VNVVKVGEYHQRSTKRLVVIIPKNHADREADAAIHRAAIPGGTQEVLIVKDEQFFHQLRLRSAQCPEVMDMVDVFYAQDDGRLEPMGLRFEDELRWPAGAFSEGWEKEAKINLVRQRANAESPESIARYENMLGIHMPDDKDFTP
jgi:hypothetical protein